MFYHFVLSIMYIIAATNVAIVSKKIPRFYLSCYIYHLFNTKFNSIKKNAWKYYFYYFGNGTKICNKRNSKSNSLNRKWNVLQFSRKRNKKISNVRLHTYFTFYLHGIWEVYGPLDKIRNSESYPYDFNIWINFKDSLPHVAFSEYSARLFFLILLIGRIIISILFIPT